jgi:uncharacterized protein (DUF1501 family)
LFGQQAGSNALASILTAEETNLFAKEYEVVVNRSTAAQATLATSMLPAGVGGVANPPQYLDPMTNKLANNNFPTSLQTVARIIGGRGGLGVSRQIFYVTVGGFDTHDNQAPQHARLLTQLSQGLEYFDATMTTLGLNNNVTTFTASDFGRTLTANSDGTDHGWGSHHIVTGGAVAGGDMYHLGRTIRGNARALVWAFESPDQAGISQLCQLRLESVSRPDGLGCAANIDGIHRLRMQRMHPVGINSSFLSYP